MQYLTIAAAIAAVLLIVQRLLQSAKADHIINQLTPTEDQKKAEEYREEIEKVTQEIKNADIRYSNAKRALDDTARNPDGSAYAGVSSGEVQSLQGSDRSRGPSDSGTR